MDAPPSYEVATGSSPTASSRPISSGRRLSRNEIPAMSRRSMEDESRPLPPGWVRQFDPQEQHQFFVDTNADPPRAIWQHPYDDEAYLGTLDPAEREAKSGLLKPPKSKADLEAESTDEELDLRETKSSSGKAGPSSSTSPATAAGPSSAAFLSPASAKGKSTFGRKMKDKLTGSTHEEREVKRKQRAEQERRAYEMHRRVRVAMARAMETGQPQLVGKDSSGKDIYVEPPTSPRGYGGYGGYGQGAYGYNPYSQGPYDNPNARFIRPQVPYSRPYGGGYGGGYGLPIAGGLMGGLLLGGLIGGF